MVGAAAVVSGAGGAAWVVAIVVVVVTAVVVDSLTVAFLLLRVWLCRREYDASYRRRHPVALWTEERHRRLNEQQRAYAATPEAKAKARARRATPEAKAKERARNKARWADPDFRAKERAPQPPPAGRTECLLKLAARRRLHGAHIRHHRTLRAQI